MSEPENDSTRKREATSVASSIPGSAGHDEWLLDESIEETFPASDATLPVRPGSNLWARNRASRDN